MMLTALRSCPARLGRLLAARAFATARSNTLTLVAVNDALTRHLPKLRTLVDAVKAEREGGHHDAAGDFLSPSCSRR